jgi:hypothetical protein
MLFYLPFSKMLGKIGTAFPRLRVSDSAGIAANPQAENPVSSHHRSAQEVAPDARDENCPNRLPA